MELSTHFSVGSNGLVSGFTYHDGALTAVKVNENSVQIGILDVGGSERELTLEHVRLLSIDGMWEGNVVDSIFFWDASSIPLRELHAFCERRAVEESFVLDQLRKGLGLFSLVCSFGAEIYCLCGSLEIKT